MRAWPDTPDVTRRQIGTVLALAVIAGGAILGVTSPRAPRDRPEFPLKFDVNTAPREALAALPNLGPARLAAIERARQEAPIASLADLDRRVKGIGPVIASELAPYLRFPDDR